MIDINSESFRQATEICSRLKLHEFLPVVDYSKSRPVFSAKFKREVFRRICPRNGQTNSRTRRKVRRLIKSIEGTSAND